jgi:hypothetical protein
MTCIYCSSLKFGKYKINCSECNMLVCDECVDKLDMFYIGNLIKSHATDDIECFRVITCENHTVLKCDACNDVKPILLSCPKCNNNICSPCLVDYWFCCPPRSCPKCKWEQTAIEYVNE